MCGAVFHEISEGIMAKKLKHNIQVARDSASCAIPDVKAGNLLAADYVLSHLKVNTIGGWNGIHTTGNPIWGNVEKGHNGVRFTKHSETTKALVPDVRGMGARDAVYLLENYGIKVRISGRGKVKKQSVAPNSKVVKNMHIDIELG